MAAGLLDEGAGPYDSQAFRAELEDHAIRLHFEADRDGLTGELRTLTATRAHAFELLRLALTAAALRRRSRSSACAARSWPSCAGARPTPTTSPRAAGSPRPSPAIPTAARPEARREPWPRSPSTTAAPSSHAASAATGWWSAWPATSPPRSWRRCWTRPSATCRPARRCPSWCRCAPRVGRTEVQRLAIPQSVVAFGHAGLDRHDPDYYAAYVANYILGGGGFSSRLLEEIREKRGLAYSAYSYLTSSTQRPCGWVASPPTTSRSAQSIAHRAPRAGADGAGRARRHRPRQRPDLPHRLVPAAADQQRPDGQDAGQHAACTTSAATSSSAATRWSRR